MPQDRHLVRFDSEHARPSPFRGALLESAQPAYAHGPHSGDLQHALMDRVDADVAAETAGVRVEQAVGARSRPA